jgi:Crp-like helix-turn-helix domain
MRLTHQDLARMIACRRGSVSKEMIRFQRAGLTESRGPGRLVVLDKSKLGEIARGGNGEVSAIHATS